MYFFILIDIFNVIIGIIFSMKKNSLADKAMLFKGSKYLNSRKNYFEGWYFKHSNDVMSISFIPGININKEGGKAFIQVITNEESYYVNYDIKEFEYSNEPFYVKIGNNYFSMSGIHIDIKDDDNNLVIMGDVNYFDSINIDVSWLSPNIMGIFSYVPFMECNHAIGSMKNRCNGMISINGKETCFNDGTSYIEKDWGCSFPSSYIWCQGNNFGNRNSAFMLSIADIPYGFVNFRGLICSLIIEDKEYRFATYNGAKIVKCDIKDNMVDIELKRREFHLKVKAKCDSGYKLNAPVKGVMSKEIIESIKGVIKVTLIKDEDVIFDDVSKNCGLEVVCE